MRGFSLVESLMAILILTMSIMAPLSLALQTVKYSRIATQKMEATYMAEEAIEIIQNVKKSAEVFCADSNNSSSNNGPCDNDYFLSYFLDQTNSGDNVLDSDCVGNIPLNLNSKNFCNIDMSNIAEGNDKSIKLQGAESNSGPSPKNFLIKNSNTGSEDLSFTTAQITDYKRSINITILDSNKDSTDTNSGYNNSVLVTSIVCIKDGIDWNTSVCDENTVNKVMLQNLVSR